MNFQESLIDKLKHDIGILHQGISLMESGISKYGEVSNGWIIDKTKETKDLYQRLSSDLERQLSSLEKAAL